MQATFGNQSRNINNDNRLPEKTLSIGEDNYFAHLLQQTKEAEFSDRKEDVLDAFLVELAVAQREATINDVIYHSHLRRKIVGTKAHCRP